VASYQSCQTLSEAGASTVNASGSPLYACIRFLLGRQLANRESRERQIGVTHARGTLTAIVVIGVPWYLTAPKIADALPEEELAEPVRIRNVFGSQAHRRSA
jgi:hypothetical protein